MSAKWKNSLLKTQKMDLPNPALENAIKDFGLLDDEGRGAFYTKKEVVDFMLDLLGYTEDKELSKKSLLEPGFGHGVFILSAARRLLSSAKKHNRLTIADLRDSIRGIEISTQSLEYTKQHLLSLLEEFNFSREDSLELTSNWLILGDFLLTNIDERFDYVVGNPPYVRLENIDKILLSEYRERFPTMGNRSDLYIGFFERSLDLLKQGGVLTFICADRWVKNKYGEGLRNKIDESFHLEYILNLHNAEPFETSVSAYPAIFVIKKNSQKSTIYRELSDISHKSLMTELHLFDVLFDKTSKPAPARIDWHFESPDLAKVLREFNSKFPTIEEAGIKVGIGIATGNDRLFIVEDKDSLNIEKDRLLKLALREDIKDERLTWSGKYVINTFNVEGDLIDLNDYPGLKDYFLENKDSLMKRHVSQKKPTQWYRTIDKPNLNLLNGSKIYIPDIMFSPHIAYTTDSFYPHHNLYWASSNVWDVRALKTILKSAIGFLYVDTFSTRMRGGYYRYQAQTLKKIRVPNWNDVLPADQKELISLHESEDFDAIDDVVLRVYGLSNIPFRNSEPHGLRLSKLREAHS